MVNINYKEKKQKEDIIYSKNKYDFVYFVQDASQEDILNLLDQEGIELLSKSENLISYLNAIITSCRSYVSILFENELFCNLFTDKFFRNNKYLIYNLSNKSAFKIISYCIDNKDKKLSLDIFSNLSENAKKHIIEKQLFLKEDIINIITVLPKNCLDYIFKEYKDENLISEISIDELRIISEKYPVFNNKLSKSLLSKLIQTSDVTMYRFIVNNISVNNEVLDIEEKRSIYCNNLLNLIEKKEILPDFKIIMNDIIKNKYVDHDAIKNNNLFISQEYFYNWKMSNYSLSNKTQEEIIKYFQEFSEKKASEFIIDYHFKDYYDNVTLDIKNILNYNHQKNDTIINSVDSSFYSLILHINETNYEQKLRLHNYMKQINVQEKFYDIVRKCKNDAYQLLKESIITDKETESKFINQELTKKNKVETYLLEGQPFYALVKCLNDETSNLLSNDFSITNSNKGSYSVISQDDLSTFYEPQKNYTIVYTDFNPEYIMHTYPNDSFSHYSWKNELNNNLIHEHSNEIHTPESLVKSGNGYNELLILNTTYNEEMIKSNPKAGFILCYDVISENQIISAKNNNLKILLVKTSCYTKNLYETAPSILSDNVSKYKNKP